MLKEKIEADLKEALRRGDTEVVSTLRFLLSSLHNREIELKPKGKNLSEEDVLAVMRKQVKQRRESIEAFKKGSREDLVRKEKRELGILQNYLPKQTGKAGLRFTFSLIDDEKMQELNRKHRGKKYTTDVLSFELSEKLPDGTILMGDVVVNKEQAEKQAKELGHPIEEEIAFLVAHGVLHLLGKHH